MRGFSLYLLLTLIAGSAYGADEPLRIVSIGDSHTAGPYGKYLDAYLRLLSNGEARVVTVGSSGASPGWFLGTRSVSTGVGYWSRDTRGTIINRSTHVTPKLSQLMKNVDPDLVIMNLGANLIGQSESAIVRSVSRMMVEVKRGNPDQKCLWVGPPHGMNKTEPKYGNLYLAIQKAIGNQCAFFDSRPSKLPYLHYGKLWTEYKPILAKINERRIAQGRKPLRPDGRHYSTLGGPGDRAVRRWAAEVLKAAIEITAVE